MLTIVSMIIILPGLAVPIMVEPMITICGGTSERSAS